MLSTQNFDFILTLLCEQKNMLVATKYYLAHQLQMPPNHRVCSDDEETMENELKTINIQILKYEKAILEFTQS